MRHPPIAAGQKYGRLTAVSFHGLDHRKKSVWAFLCDCGTAVNRPIAGVRCGKTRSCGCLNREVASSKTAARALASTKHGQGRRRQKSSEYSTWKEMRQRCGNPKHKRYADYGGRGITVCERWNDFATFFADMGSRPSPEHSLERIDNDGGYSPENCRWATNVEQARNTRANHKVRFRGKEMCLSEACELSGLNHGTVKSRLKRGWSDEDAFRTGERN